MKLTKSILVLMSLSLAGISCGSSDSDDDGTGGGGNGNTDGELVLNTSTNAIKSDGKDYSDFTVYMGDTDVTKDAEIYLVSQTPTVLPSTRYTSTQEGNVAFFASYGDKVSAQTIVKVLSEIPDLPTDDQPANLSFKRRVLALQLTGTACPNCPYMMGSIQEVLKTDVAEKVLFTAIHSYNYDDIMYNKTVAAMGQAYGNGYYPGIGCNMRKEVLNAVGSVDITAGKLKTMINSAYEGNAKAGISASVLRSGNQIIVKASVKASQAGKYRIGAWVLENGIYAKQANSGVTGDYDFDTHNNVVRAAAGVNGDYDFSGDDLGNIKAGETKSFVMTMPVSNEWVLEKCKVVLFVSTPDEGTAKKFYVTNATLCNIDQVVKFEY